MIEILNEETGLAEDWYTVAELAKHLNLKDGEDKPIGRNKMFRLLRLNNILMDNNYPFQYYLNLDLIHMRKVQKIRHTVSIPIFSMRGLNYFKRRFGNEKFEM